MRYDYECECGIIFEAEKPMRSASLDSEECPECGKVAHRAFIAAPGMIVHGTSKNSRDEDDFAPEHIAAAVPQKALKRGYTTEKYERLHRKDRKRSEAFWRDVDRSRKGESLADGAIRKVGEIPTAKALAMIRENGGDMPTTDQLLRRGCLFEHEKKNIKK